MSYDVEWSAGADFQQVIKSLENVEKTLGAMERAAQRGFDRAEKSANVFTRSIDRMTSLAFFSKAMSSAGNFLSSSLQAAAEDSKEVATQLERVEKAWHRMKAGIGSDLMTQAGGGNGAAVEGWIDMAETVRQKTVDAMANVLSVWATLGRGLVGNMSGAGNNVRDLEAGGAFSVRRDQERTVEIDKRAAQIKAATDQYKTLEKAAARADMTEDARARADAMDRYNDALAKAADLRNASHSADGYARAEAAAKRILDIELKGIDAKAQAIAAAEEERRILADQAELEEMIMRDRARMRGLEQLDHTNTATGIETLRMLGADRDAERLRVRMQTVDAIDALQMRTDITDGDKARMRGELVHAEQWKKDALELSFQAEDERMKRVVSSRGFAGGLAGANAGVSAAALSGSLDPSLKAAQQTASQTKESARLLAEIEKNLRKREAAVYGN